jgi:hypothetical protein
VLILSENAQQRLDRVDIPLQHFSHDKSFVFSCPGGRAGRFMAITALGAAEPTEYEQYFLELINRARSAPEAEVQLALANSTNPSGTFARIYYPFVGVPSLNEGPPALGDAAYTIPGGPKQPLAFNPDLVAVSRAYAGVCQQNNSIDHYFNNTDPDGRMTSGGYTTDFPWNDALEIPVGGGLFYGPGAENLSQVLGTLPWGSTEHAVDLRREALDVMHHGLFVDGSASDRSHRLTMMAGDYREVGIGLSFGTDPKDANPTFWQSAYACMDAGHQEGRGPFITGVVYREKVADGFYTPGQGEALGGLSVQILQSGTATEVARTTTFASGGYGVLVPASHTYDVVITGPQVSRTLRAVVVGTLNVKVDAVEPPVPPVPPVASEFGITLITHAGNTVTLAWSTTPGLVYRVAISPDLINWTPLTSSQQTATSTTLRYVDSSAAVPGNRYYRIERL